MDYVSHGLFYHIVKHVNRLAHYHLVFAQLADLDQQEISEEELAIATFMCVPKEEVENTLTRGDMKKLWRFYINTTQ
jgi:hypothetical protein